MKIGTKWIVAGLFWISTCAWAQQATFDGSTGVLTLPAVKVGSATYTNVLLGLINPANYTFRLQAATAQVPAGPADITFDGGTGVVTIPSVAVGSAAYSVTLQLTDANTYTFALATATLIPPAGPTLYGLYCASCHGALASSTKGGATVARIQAAITSNTGGMGTLSTLSAIQVTAIASALALIPPTTAACGSCHAIPPATGKHGQHQTQSCAVCHGVGYSSTSVSAVTHNNGVVDLTGTIGWTSTSKTCSNSCHGQESW
jgi:mono/diheme cytochrome c family protein